MVVRETPSLADSVEELLTSEGYQVRRVNGTDEAVRLLDTPRGRTVRAAVVVCNEPVCSGLEGLKSLLGRVPILVLGWRGLPFITRGPSDVTLVRLPISAGALLDNLRALTEGPASGPVPPASR